MADFERHFEEAKELIENIALKKLAEGEKSDLDRQIAERHLNSFSEQECRSILVGLESKGYLKLRFISNADGGSPIMLVGLTDAGRKYAQEISEIGSIKKFFSNCRP